MITSRLRRSFYNPAFRQPTGLEMVAGASRAADVLLQLSCLRVSCFSAWVWHCIPRPHPVIRFLTPSLTLPTIAGLETGLENDAQAQVMLRCSPSTTVSFDVWAPEIGSTTLNSLGSAVKDVKAKVGVEMTTDSVSLSSAHFLGSTRFLLSAVTGAMGWAGGLSAIFNTYNGRRKRNAQAIQDPRFALQYTCDTFQVSHVYCL